MKNSTPFKFSSIVLLLLLTACNKDDISPTYDLAGNWTVIAFDDYAELKKITKSEENSWMDYNNGDITINFDETGYDGKGEYSGKNVTNGYSGKYSISSEGKISIDPFLTTLINEPEWARLFHSVIKAETYEVRNQTLIIFYNNRENSISFKRS